MGCCRGGVGSYTLPRMMVILQEIAAALAYMHENGITHNDMKLRPEPNSIPRSGSSELVAPTPGPRTSSCTAKAAPTSVTVGREDAAKRPVTMTGMCLHARFGSVPFAFAPGYIHSKLGDLGLAQKSKNRTSDVTRSSAHPSYCGLGAGGGTMCLGPRVDLLRIQYPHHV